VVAHGGIAGLFSYALVALLVIIDPAGTAVLFLGMTPHDTAAERASQATRACVIAFVVLAAFGLGGEALLRQLGISLPAMKVAGGILLFITAADMVTAHGALRATTSEREAATRTEEDISVFPLAIPFIAGPGAMTTMVLLHSMAGGSAAGIAAIQAALVVALGLTLVARRLSFRRTSSAPTARASAVRSGGSAKSRRTSASPAMACAALKPES